MNEGSYRLVVSGRAPGHSPPRGRTVPFDTDRAMSGSNLFTGTLDLLILRSLAWGPRHGYAIGSWIRRSSSDALQVEEGVLYPALHRLEGKGWLSADWGVTETKRRAKFYELTERGERALESEKERWDTHTEAVAAVLRATHDGS